MKKFTFITLVIAAMLCFARVGCAQGTLAPLYLSTNGDGSITPYGNGQLLEVGQSYNMTAIPDSGFAFSSWQPLNAFIRTVVYTNGGTIGTNTSMNFVPLPQYIKTPTLTFTMQPQIVIANNLYESSGWLANFVPVPEPSDVTFITWGFTALMLLRRKEITKSRTMPLKSKAT